MDYDYTPAGPFLDQEEEEKQNFSYAPDVQSVQQYVDSTYTTTELRDDPRITEAFEKVSSYLNENENIYSRILDTGWGTNDDPIEYLRDETLKTGTLLTRANIFKDAPEDVKAAQRYLRQRMDSAKIDDWGSFIKDYTGDVLSGPEGLIAVGSLITSIFTGGASGAAAATATTAARQGAAKAIKSAAGAISTPTALAAEGAVFGGLDDYASQNLEVAIGEREDTSGAQVAVMAVAGGVLGGTLGLGAKKLSKSRIDSKALENTEALEGYNSTTTIASESPENLAKARALIEEARAVPQQGDLDFDGAPIQGQLDFGMPPMPSSSAKLADSFGANIQGKDVADLDPERLLDENELDAFVSYIGGGEKTRKKIRDEAIAAANDANKDNAYNRFAFSLYEIASNFTSRFAGGKAPGVLTPFADFSGTAKVLQGKLSREFAKQWRGEQATIGEDLFEAQRRITGHYWRRYLSVVQPYRLGTLAGKLKDQENNLLSLAMRGKPAKDKKLNGAALEIKRMYSDIGDILKREGIIKHKIENYIPRMWNRAGIENNPDKLAQLLLEDGEAKTLQEAEKIVTGMLNKESQIDSGTTGHFFSARRSFDKIKDDSKYEEFLNQDVSASLYGYITQAGRALAKKRVLGVKNIKGFEKKWVNQIEKEMIKKTGKGLSESQRKNLLATYTHATGEGLMEMPLKSFRTATEGLSLVNQLAYLPLATLTSFPEVLLNIGRAGVFNSVKGFKEAFEISHNTITKDAHKMLQSRHGMTAQEAWDEMQGFGLAMDQTLDQIGNRLTGGEEIVNEKIQNASKWFFRKNLLEQWTNFAQLVAYNSGRNMIQENIETIARHGKGRITPRIQAKRDELAELGIDLPKALNWYGGGRKTNDPFFQEIKAAAARYTNDVILNPTAMSGTKPRLYTKPTTSFLFQILSYPAAFSNTVLKGAAKTFVRNPTKENVAKISAGALSLVGMQAAINYIKTRGESAQDKEAHEIAFDALQRAGGLSFVADAAERARTSAMYRRSLSPYSMMFFGPAAQDIQDIGSGRLGRFASSKVPFGTAITAVEKYTGTEMMDTIKDAGKNLDRELRDIGISPMPSNIRREMFAKGGEVNVPNAPKEPDERIDKMTGQPYNIQAGSAFVDEEDPDKNLI